MEINGWSWDFQPKRYDFWMQRANGAWFFIKKIYWQIKKRSCHFLSISYMGMIISLPNSIMVGPTLFTKKLDKLTDKKYIF